MEKKLPVLSRRGALVAAVAILATCIPLYAGIPKVPRGKNNDDQGPYGLPGLKRLTEALSLTQPQEQDILRIYNEYKHREHEEKQSKTASGTSGLQDCISAVKKDLTPDQQKKFDELLNDQGKKKKN